jgi:hypothetical protein
MKTIKSQKKIIIKSIFQDEKGEKYIIDKDGIKRYI